MSNRRLHVSYPALICYSAVAALAFVLSVCAMLITRQIVSVGAVTTDTVANIRDAVIEVRPEILQTVKQTKAAAFAVQSAAKAASEEVKDVEAQKERLNIFRSTNVVLGQTARILDGLETGTIPALTQTANEASALLAGTNHRLNDELLPSITNVSRNLASLAGAFEADEREIAIQLGAAIKRGEATLDQIAKILDSERIGRILGNVESSSKHFDGTAANIEEMSKRFPELADRVNRILRTGNTVQKAALIASLLIQLAKLFT